MKKSYLIFIVLLLGAVTLFPTIVYADVLSINYPAPNDIISESSRIRLNVTSNGTSADCLFSYDGVKNQSVSCNGVSLVNLPNADETYRIRVTDDSGSYVDQQLTIKKPSPTTSNLLFILSAVLLVGSVFWIIYLIKLLAMMDMKWFHLAISFCMFFSFILVYQLDLEYLNIPFIFDYLDIFYQAGAYLMIIFPLIAYFVCSTVRSFKKKKLLSPQEL